MGAGMEEWLHVLGPTLRPAARLSLPWAYGTTSSLWMVHSACRVRRTVPGPRGGTEPVGSALRTSATSTHLHRTTESLLPPVIYSTADTATSPAGMATSGSRSAAG